MCWPMAAWHSLNCMPVRLASLLVDEQREQLGLTRILPDSALHFVSGHILLRITLSSGNRLQLPAAFAQKLACNGANDLGACL